MVSQGQELAFWQAIAPDTSKSDSGVLASASIADSHSCWARQSNIPRQPLVTMHWRTARQGSLMAHSTATTPQLWHRHPTQESAGSEEHTASTTCSTWSPPSPCLPPEDSRSEDPASPPLPPPPPNSTRSKSSSTVRPPQEPDMTATTKRAENTARRETAFWFLVDVVMGWFQEVPGNGAGQREDTTDNRGMPFWGCLGATGPLPIRVHAPGSTLPATRHGMCVTARSHRNGQMRPSLCHARGRAGWVGSPRRRRGRRQSRSIRLTASPAREAVSLGWLTASPEREAVSLGSAHRVAGPRPNPLRSRQGATWVGDAHYS